MSEMRSLETITIVNPKKKKNKDAPEVVIINLEDFDPKKHTKAKAPEPVSAQAQAEEVLKKAEEMMKDATAMMEQVQAAAGKPGSKKDDKDNKDDPKTK